jgi:hypothetical protein
MQAVHMDDGGAVVEVEVTETVFGASISTL